MGEIINTVFQIITSVILVYFFALNSIYIILILLSIIGINHYRNKTAFVSFKELFHLPLIKPISIIAPVYNEENSVIESTLSLLSLEYPQYEIIVVNDGSKDDTLKKLISTFDLKITNRIYRKVIDTKTIKNIYTSPTISKLVVIDKKNGGKADAMNAGLNISRYPLFCTLDGDSILEKEALLKMVRPFLEDPEKTVAAGGVIRLSNGCEVKSGQVVNVQLPRNIPALFQIIEYYRAFLGGRLGLSMIKSVLIISGAFGLFRKDITLQCGGYNTNTVGEDVDLIIRIRKYLHEKKIPFSIQFIPDPICWTEAPESMKDLSRQRNRWQRGLIEAIIHNSRVFLNPRYGITGLFAVPFYVVFEMLGPIVEMLGYIIFISFFAVGKLNYAFCWMFFIFAVILGVILSLLSLLLGEYSIRRYPRLRDVAILFLFSILENFFYRQYLSLVRFKAFFDYLLGKQSWEEMTKKGFTKAK